LGGGPLPEAKEVHMSISKSRPIDMALEVVVIPVSDVDRALRFYGGWGGGRMQISRTAAIFGWFNSHTFREWAERQRKSIDGVGA
jgi:hypothetical protein